MKYLAKVNLKITNIIIRALKKKNYKNLFIFNKILCKKN